MTVDALRKRHVGAKRRAMTAALAPSVRAVSVSVSSGTRPGRRYWSDCYRRASDYVLAHTPGQGPCPPVEGMRLVHGVCGDARGLWAHAWVDLPDPSGARGLVFDGVRQEFYDRDGYCRVLHAIAEASYDAPGMTERMHASGRYGPWHAGVLGRNATGRHRSETAGEHGAVGQSLSSAWRLRTIVHDVPRSREQT
jgi:hypothetical protein